MGPGTREDTKRSLRLVPKDNFYRQVDQCIDLSFVRDLAFRIPKLIHGKRSYFYFAMNFLLSASMILREAYRCRGVLLQQPLHLPALLHKLGAFKLPDLEQMR